jgi:germination protein M
MLKRMLSRKVFVSTAVLFALFLLYVIPKDDNHNLNNKIPQDLEYVNTEVITSTIYLLDSHNYLGRASVVVSNSNKNIEAKARELIEILIKDGAGENKIPNGFRSLIPSDTKLLSLKYDEGVIKVNFSKELLDVSENLEEKVISALVYTLTKIDGVNSIILYVEGDILDKLPKSKINLPSTLDRSFGINKEYDIKSYKGINQVTIYYVNKYNDNYYYVPVTKYLNDDREKIKIIIEELSSTHLYNSNLMSFLNNNAKLLASEQADDILQLKFNSYIFDDDVEKSILEEVIYTICLSVGDNYNVKEVVFEVNDEEIYKTVLKTIE